MGDEGTQVAGGRIGHPHGGEAIVLQQVEQVLSVAAIGLCLADDHGPNLRGFPDEQGVLQLLHEGMKPEGVARCLDPNRHWPRQRAVEALDRVPLVQEFLLQDFASVGIQDGDLLLPAVQIATDQGHDGLLSRVAVALGWPEPINSGGPFS